MGRRIASESKQTVRGGPKPAKVGLHRRLIDDRRTMPKHILAWGYLIDILYTLDSASNYSAIQKLKP